MYDRDHYVQSGRKGALKSEALRLAAKVALEEKQQRESEIEAGVFMVEAPDGTKVKLSDAEEVEIFNTTVANFQADYEDWKAPDRQQLTGLAMLRVGLHRLQEASRRTQDAEDQAKTLIEMTKLVKTTYEVHTQMGMSRKQRDASRKDEGAGKWIDRLREDLEKHP